MFPDSNPQGPRILVGLVSENNDYQKAQAQAAEDAANANLASVEMVYCNGDAVEQSQQLLQRVLAKSDESKISGIIVQPVGTSLRQVAQAAAAAGIGWVILHREVEYFSELRAKHSVPIFAVSSDHKEEGHIHAMQLAALLPKGGRVLYITGPNVDSVAQKRADGINHSKPANIQLLTMRGNWSVESGHKAVLSWWKLSTSKQQPIDAVVAQNDAMALGAKQALQELAEEILAKVFVIGCDGVPESGQLWVKKGDLKATVIVPVVAGVAVEMLVKGIKEKRTFPEQTVIAPTSYPNLTELGRFRV